MLPFKTVLHICGLMDQFNPKNVLKLSKLLILTLLLMPSCLQHMVSSPLFFFCFLRDSPRKLVDSNHFLQLVGLV